MAHCVDVPDFEEERKPFMTDQEMEDALLFPDVHATTIDFWGTTLSVRALPIKHAKKLRAILRPIASKVQQNLTAAAPGGGDAVVQVEAEALTNQTAEALDEATTEALMNAAAMLCADFYKPKEDLETAAQYKEQMENEVAFGEVYCLLHTQQKVQGEADFFFRELRAVLKMLDLVRAVTKHFQALQPTAVIARLGASDLTS